MENEARSYQDQLSDLERRIDVLRHQASGIARTVRMGIPVDKKLALRALDASYDRIKFMFENLFDLAEAAGQESGEVRGTSG